FPTKAGEVLLAHAGRARRELDAGLEVVQQLRGVVAGRIRLGTSASFSIYLLPPALRRFRSRYPKTELTVVTGNAPEIARGVVRRKDKPKPPVLEAFLATLDGLRRSFE